jgi:hypothetical protein
MTPMEPNAQSIKAPPEWELTEVTENQCSRNHNQAGDDPGVDHPDIAVWIEQRPDEKDCDDEMTESSQSAP